MFQVNGTDFRSCNVPNESEGSTSGNDVFLLVSEGRKWYLCGVGDHCQNGQKLFINVLPSEPEVPSVPTASPSPSPSPMASPSDLLAKYRWLPRKMFTIFHY